MLQAVLEFINNWFEREVYAGEWTISNGSLTVNPGIQEAKWRRQNDLRRYRNGG